jgi:hypothetical protein
VRSALATLAAIASIAAGIIAASPERGRDTARAFGPKPARPKPPEL